MSVMTMDILPDLEHTIDINNARKGRFLPSRRLSASCSRLAPVPLPDLLVLEQLYKNRDVPRHSPIKECYQIPSRDEIMRSTSTSSATFSSRQYSARSAYPPPIAPSSARKRSEKKGKSWFHPKTWMRKKRHHLNTPTSVEDPPEIIRGEVYVI